MVKKQNGIKNIIGIEEVKKIMDENKLIIDGFTMQELLFQLGDLRKSNEHLQEEIRSLGHLLQEKDATIETLKKLLLKENE